MVVNDDLNHWFGEEISIFAIVKSVDESVANLYVLVYMLNVEELKRHRLSRSFQRMILTQSLSRCLLKQGLFYFLLFAPDRGFDDTILDPIDFIYYTSTHIGLNLVVEAVIYLFQALREII